MRVAGAGVGASRVSPRGPAVHRADGSLGVRLAPGLEAILHKVSIKSANTPHGSPTRSPAVKRKREAQTRDRPEETWPRWRLRRRRCWHRGGDKLPAEHKQPPISYKYRRSDKPGPGAGRGEGEGVPAPPRPPPPVTQRPRHVTAARSLGEAEGRLGGDLGRT